MARRFLYMLMTVIALQFSWSVITAYCLHEAGQGPQHFGHHQHTAASDRHEDASQDKPNLSKKTAAHTHCSVCVHGVHSLDGIAESVFHPLLAGMAPMEDVVHPSSPYLKLPERPKWIHAA